MCIFVVQQRSNTARGFFIVVGMQWQNSSTARENRQYRLFKCVAYESRGVVVSSSVGSGREKTANPCVHLRH